MDAPTLSIVTGTRNRPESFNRLLVSIMAYTELHFELLVADASDEPLKLRSGATLKIFAERPRMGCTKGYNRVFAETRGEWVIWLNDDAEVQPGYANAAVRFMESHPEIGLGALYYREGQRDFHVNAYFDMIYANFGIISRELGNQIGWFDEEIPMYGNDNSLAFRVLLAGKGIAGIPDARVIHHAVDDELRKENGNYEKRIADAERLGVKYGPRMAEIQATYKALGCQAIGLNDQTPQFMRELANR